MAATITIHVYTGTDGATISGSVTGIDMLSADNALNTLPNRLQYPVAACSYSYEKWISACVTSSPPNKVSNFQIWGDGAVDANVALYIGAASAAATPIATCSVEADTDFTTKVVGDKFAWDSASYLATGSTTQWAVFQLIAFTDAAAGPITQETISYSYDEA